MHRFIIPIAAVSCLGSLFPLQRASADPGASSRHAPSECAPPNREQRALERSEHCEADPRVVLGQVSLETCIGADLFFRETFDGNGRTCGSCHPAENNYTLDPEFIAQLPDDDALFIAEQDPALAELEKPTLLRDFALIVVNADGFEDPTHKFVVRSVSHMLGLNTSITAPPFNIGSTTHATDGTRLPPLDRLGWSGDGAPGNGQLRDFADGAITQHMTKRLERVPGVDFGLPSDAERDAIAAFSRSIGRMNELELADVRLTDADAERGRVEFLTGSGSECSGFCHVNGGANSPQLADDSDEIFSITNASFDIGTNLVRLPEVDAMGIPLDGGFGLLPRDLDGDGVNDAFGNRAMNIAPLIEAADTAPMFHSNAFATLEDAIEHYTTDAFAESTFGANIPVGDRLPGDPIALTKEQIALIGRFLRVVNTGLNCQMARYRLEAALDVTAQYGNRYLDVQRGLIGLADAELEDALQVLSAVRRLDIAGQRSLHGARAALRDAANTRDSRKRRKLVRSALSHVRQAYAGLGTGLDLQIGAGTLMF